LAATFEAALELCMAAIRHARDENLSDIVVNIHGISGIDTVTTFMRYELAVQLAQNAGNLRVALVVPETLMDPQKFAMLMAQNRGVNADVFTRETDALEWLDARF
jgi:hypothetical protein